MTKVGIICEYNPFHNGHLRQFRQIREQYGPDTAIICLMSGNFVQRGEPALFAKEDRARAAVLSGADLVLELPVTYALSSAEGFAQGGVSLLAALGVEILSFGTETGTGDDLMKTAAALLSPELDAAILENLKTGCSYMSARQQAADSFGVGTHLRQSNDILGVEYCKAILRSGANMEIFPVRRDGSYLSTVPDPQAPSALAIRSAIAEGLPWEDCVPEAALEVYRAADRYETAWGERAVLARLRTLPDEAFSSLPYGSEGLWRKLMRACRSEPSLNDILERTKSKRYAWTRLQRMLCCAYLGITAERLTASAPYVRILGFDRRGREVLRQMKKGDFPLVDAGAVPPDPAYYDLERTCSDLYGLFLRSAEAKACGGEEKIRNFYLDL